MGKYKILGLLILTVVLWDCAVSSPVPEKKEVAPTKQVFKVKNPEADSLVYKLPGLARMFFEEIMDSLPGEYYYLAKDNAIDTLFIKKEDKFEPVAAIQYKTSPDKKGDYILAKKEFVLQVSKGMPKGQFEGEFVRDSVTGNVVGCEKNCKMTVFNEQGLVSAELFYPKYSKFFYDNGNVKVEMSGILVKKDSVKAGDGFANAVNLLDGEEKHYFDNGQLHGLAKIKDGKKYLVQEWNDAGQMVRESVYGADGLILSEKVWNENGILQLEFKMGIVNFYFENGKLRGQFSGKIYKDEKNAFALDSGASKMYSENGKILEDAEWKNKVLIALKECNEQGVLIRDISITKNYGKEYYDDGKIKSEMIGTLYRGDDGDFRVDSGSFKMYSPNGQILDDTEWKNKALIRHKMWNEQGVLIKDFSFSENYLKKYYDDGKIKSEMIGTLYRGDDGVFKVDSGTSKLYAENGRILEETKWKNKVMIASKNWNEQGVLIGELSLAEKYLKEYYDDGKMKGVTTGSLYWGDDGNVKVDSGTSKTYSESGQILENFDLKNKGINAYKKWNAQGVLIEEFSLMGRFAKKYYDSGKIKMEVTGILYQGDDGNSKVDSGTSKLYFENGNPLEESEWKNKVMIAKRGWNERGVLVEDICFTKNYLKEYYEDGKIKGEMMGSLYWDGDDIIKMENGTHTLYFENGRILEESEWKNKVLTSYRVWNEQGVLIEELSLMGKYVKEYYDNGAMKLSIQGSLVHKGPGILFGVLDGCEKMYYEDGSLEEMRKYDHYGNVNSIRKYEKNILIGETFGIVDATDDCVLWGHKMSYSKEGNLLSRIEYKNKKIVSKKEWNEQGVLVKDIQLPEYYKEFGANGKITLEAVGTIVENNGSFSVKDGILKSYGTDGRVEKTIKYQNFEELSD